MAIKRYAICTCDGPCGSHVEGGKPPARWTVLTFRACGAEKDRATMALCSDCLKQLEALLNRSGFAIQEIDHAKKSAVVTAHAAVNCPACGTVKCLKYYMTGAER